MGQVYHRLDPQRIVETAERLTRRVEERFPGSGLGGVAATLLSVAREAESRSVAIQRPLVALRFSVGVVIVVMGAVAAWTAAWMALQNAPSTWSELAQGIDATLNVFILVGGSIVFLVTLETRIKRRRALHALSELRVLAHVIEMHQLTKDPERLIFAGRPTPSSPPFAMSAFELTRYLDYCSDMLAVIGNLAGLYAQGCEDPVALDAIDAIERLTTGIAQKIWQKLTIINDVVRSAANVETRAP